MPHLIFVHTFAAIFASNHSFPFLSNFHDKFFNKRWSLNHLSIVLIIRCFSNTKMTNLTIAIFNFISTRSCTNRLSSILSMKSNIWFRFRSYLFYFYLKKIVVSLTTFCIYFLNYLLLISISWINSLFFPFPFDWKLSFWDLITCQTTIFF